MYRMSSITLSPVTRLRGSTACSSTRTCGTVNAADFFSQPAALPDQKVMRQKTQRHVMVPPPQPRTSY